MSKRIRAITLSCVTVLCCLAIMVAGTYALFSDSVEVVNHLQAGNLKVQLSRDMLSLTLLDENGLLSTTTDNNAKDFTNEKSNIFGLTDDAKIVPGCSLEAVFSLVNVGDVAIGYYLEFVLEGDANEFASQLELTVSVGSQKWTPIKLSQLGNKYLFGNGEPLGRILQGDSASAFTVKLEFVDGNDNNAAQDKNVKVDMIVHAIQITE